MSDSTIECGNCKTRYDMGDYSKGFSERGAPFELREDCPHCGYLHKQDRTKKPWEDGFNYWIKP